MYKKQISAIGNTTIPNAITYKKTVEICYTTLVSENG